MGKGATCFILALKQSSHLGHQRNKKGDGEQPGPHQGDSQRGEKYPNQQLTQTCCPRLTHIYTHRHAHTQPYHPELTLQCTESQRQKATPVRLDCTGLDWAGDGLPWDTGTLGHVKISITHRGMRRIKFKELKRNFRKGEANMAWPAGKEMVAASLFHHGSQCLSQLKEL